MGSWFQKTGYFKGLLYYHKTYIFSDIKENWLLRTSFHVSAFSRVLYQTGQKIKKHKQERNEFKKVSQAREDINKVKKRINMDFRNQKRLSAYIALQKVMDALLFKETLELNTEIHHRSARRS